MSSVISREDVIAMGELPDEYWRAIFDKLDRDGDGVIKLKEFRGQGKGIPNDIPDDVKRKLFSKADVDRNGQLDYAEFHHLVHSPEVQKTISQWFTGNARSYAKLVVAPRELGADQTDGDAYMKLYSCMPPPLFIPLASLIELIIFIYYAIEMGGVGYYGPVPTDSPLIYNPYLRYQVWRFITYMFIHSGILHILNNILIQVMLGIPLEMAHGWWRISIVYMAGVIAGSLGTSITDPNVFLAGASGGVYSIMTAHLATMILNWKDMKFPIVQLFIFMIIMGVDVGSAVYNRYANSDEPGNAVAYAAHLSGALAGLLVGIGVLKNVSISKWEKWLWWASMITFGVLVFIAIIWNAAFPEYFPESR